ncbi:Rossmann-fold NAD(P)-binding domain-containing protein [Anianabacter salinae]|uniref:epimerase n=1 Tax=Anianabacter salinae TaxID=2851023 RepID=UPI00225E08A2|nr:epimerase [Anianabacter salinae]MBV0913698.1 epimerase [Anianabacter salinae]
MTKTALVLGASGRFGRNAAQAFWNAGWRVRSFDRKTDDLMRAAQGVDIIVNAWNPPYNEWTRTLPEMSRQLIAAARAADVPILQAGNVYNYGADMPPVLTPDTPWRGRNSLSLARQRFETELRESGLKVTVLRAGDFIDTEASGNWFDKVLIANLAKGRLVYPGPVELPHAWAYLPDMALAAVQLAEKGDSLAQWEDVTFPGYTLTGRELAQAIGRVTGKAPRLTRFNWLPLRLFRRFIPMAPGLIEMSYLWRTPHQLDGARFTELLPDFPATPLDEALRLGVQHQVDPD